jgi:nitrilase
MSSGADKAANVGAARALVAQAVARERPDLVVLPETWDFVGGTLAERIAAAEAFPDGPAYRACAALAREHKVWLHAGSIRERCAGGRDRIGNTTVVFDRDGREVARYRKIHLFDVTLPDGTAHNESAAVAPGRDVVTYDLEGVLVGCAICYDLRFPELFRALADRGARVIALPSAFTLQTGRDHWEVLCRARAIETQTWFLAAAQWGPHRSDGEPRFTFGRSLIVDPWGTVVAQATDGSDGCAATLDLARVERVRAQIPVARHRVL